jgi:hypothetical protein
MTAENVPKLPPVFDPCRVFVLRQLIKDFTGFQPGGAAAWPRKSPLSRVTLNQQCSYRRAGI